MVTTRKTKPTNANAPTNFFRPTPLLAPRNGESTETYAEYILCYKMYLRSLSEFRSEFWADHQKPKSSSGATGSQPAKADPKQKLLRKKERRQRRAERKRLAAIKEETKSLRIKTSLAQAKKQYAEVVKTPAPSKKKGAKPKAAKPKVEKGKGPAKDPKPKPAPGKQDDPSGSSSAPGPSSGPRTDPGKAPNRKERRRAQFGPPAGSKAKPVKSESSEAEEAEEEEDESSDEEVVPFVNPFASSIPSFSGSAGASVLERAAASLGTISGPMVPITGSMIMGAAMDKKKPGGGMRGFPLGDLAAETAKREGEGGYGSASFFDR